MQGEDRYSSVCLVVVDIQEDFYTANQVIGETFPEFARNVPKLLDECRALGTYHLCLKIYSNSF